MFFNRSWLRNTLIFLKLKIDQMYRFIHCQIAQTQIDSRNNIFHFCRWARRSFDEMHERCVQIQHKSTKNVANWVKIFNYKYYILDTKKCTVHCSNRTAAPLHRVSFEDPSMRVFRRSLMGRNGWLIAIHLVPLQIPIVSSSLNHLTSFNFVEFLYFRRKINYSEYVNADNIVLYQ